MTVTQGESHGGEGLQLGMGKPDWRGQSNFGTVPCPLQQLWKVQGESRPIAPVFS